MLGDCYQQLTTFKAHASHVAPRCSHFILITTFPGGSVGKESTCNTGDPGSIPGLGRFPGEGKGYPLQYSGLENSMNCIIMESQELDTTTLGNYKKVSNFANSHKAKIERSGFWIKFVFGRPIPLCQAVVC